MSTDASPFSERARRAGDEGTSAVADRLRFGRFELRRVERHLLLDGVPVHLGARAFDLLLALVDRRDRVVSKGELLDLVWPGLVVEEANVQVQVSALRKILGANVIATIGGIGYRLAIPVEALEPAPLHNLPAERTGFVGRESVVKEARQQLSTTRLLTLVGIGGIGKTRLALKLAESALAEHRHGVRWVDLAPLSTAEQVEAALAEVLDYRHQGQGEPFAAIAAHCRHFELLLVLDNCEHLLDIVARAIDTLLAGAPGLRLLVTSRGALGAIGERLFPIRPLDMPRPGAPAAELMRSEAMQLFVERARNSVPRLVVDENSAPLLAEICRRLDGVPLALELGAARMRLFSATQLLALLDRRFELLAGGPRALPRQHSLQAMIRWSYEAARGEAQQTLCALAVCAGGCDLETLTALLEPASSAALVAEALAQLLDLGLVSVDRQDRRPRFSMFETVGQFALERLGECGRLKALQDRHRDHFLRLAEQADWHRQGALNREVMERLRSEQANLVRAIHGCATSDDASLGLRFVVAMRGYWASWGLLRLGRDLAMQALARHEAGRRDAWRGEACRALAQLHWWLGEAAPAMAAAEEALDIAVQLDDPRLMGQACRTISYVCGLSGQHDAAGRHAQEALRLARLVGDPIDLAGALVAVADHMAESGELANAAELHAEAYRVREVHGDLEGQGSAALALADVAIDLGALDSARQWLAIAGRLEGLTQSRYIGQHLLERSATLAAQDGQSALALRWFSASAQQRQSTGLSELTMSIRQREASLRRAAQALGPVATAAAAQSGQDIEFGQAITEVKDWLSTRDEKGRA